jgi:hypothetical protein
MFGQTGLTSSRLDINESSYELESDVMNILYPGMPYTIRISLYSPADVLLGHNDATFIFAPDLTLTPWLRYSPTGMNTATFLLLGITTNVIICALLAFSRYIPGLKRHI